MELESIKKIEITKQSEILEQTGYELDLQKGMDLIKEISQDCTVDDEDALEADRLISLLIEQRTKAKTEPKKELTKDNYIAALKGLEVMLKLAESEQEKTKYESAIKGIRVMIKLM